MLSIQHLTKSYDSKKAVDDLSLEIQPGDKLKVWFNCYGIKNCQATPIIPYRPYF